jgi:hypothetical protein
LSEISLYFGVLKMLISRTGVDGGFWTFEAHAAAEDKNAVAERELAGKQLGADELVEGVVAAHILSHAEEISHGIEKRRGVNASGNREVGLRLARDLRQ